MKKFLLIMLLPFLASCASIGSVALKAGTTGAVRFTDEDLDAAILIAQQAKDQTAEKCFVTLKKYTKPEVSAEVKGVVSAYMAARAKAQEFSKGVPEDVHVACSPLIVDSATFLSGFAARILN